MVDQLSWLKCKTAISMTFSHGFLAFPPGPVHEVSWISGAVGCRRSHLSLRLVSDMFWSFFWGGGFTLWWFYSDITGKWLVNGIFCCDSMGYEWMIPSGYLTVRHGKWPIEIDGLPINSMVISMAMLNNQMVYDFICLEHGCETCVNIYAC